MCGRARCTLQREVITAMAGVAPEAFTDGDKYRPCENMGPGRYGPVTFRGRESPTQAKHTKLQAMRWGLIPSFTKPHVKPDHFMMFNARSESLHERPAFRRLLETKRCVVFSDGYYEWHQVDKKEKQPYYLHRTTGPIKFAGLFDSWTNEDGELSYTYTILTTEAPPQLTWMHPRIPVILTEDGVRRWLSDAKFDSLRDLLVGFAGEDLKWHPVDKRVGSTKFQSEDCSKQVDIKHAANITSFFSAPTVNNEAKAQKVEACTSDTAPATKPDPSPVSQTESANTFQSDSIRGSQESESIREDEKPAFKPASAFSPPPSWATPPKAKPERSDAFHRSPIKFLFQQQQMVQQADEIFAEAKGQASPARVGTARMGTKRPASPNHPRPSPKKSKKAKPSPKKPTTQRGTLLAYFQPKS